MMSKPDATSRKGPEAPVGVIPATTRSQIKAARRLFLEYAESLGFDLDFQNFDDEIEGFPGAYAPPEGRILLALEGGEVIGCAALRRIGPEVCEMKRLFVRSSHRGRGIGKQLAEAVVREGRALGYRWMRLDTVPSMEVATGMYRKMGFRNIPPYRHNPIEGAIFMELPLA